MSEADEPTRDLSGEPAPTGGGRDHYLVQPLPWLAAASDRGQRHETNQDALDIAGRENAGHRRAVLVISDGVSTSIGAEEAAAVAVSAARATLVEAVRAEISPDDLPAAFTDAFQNANQAVLALAESTGSGGSCTLIAATVDGPVITVGNVGDSRCYWVGEDGGSSVLSTDDSVAQARIELGMSREEAESGYQAHAITRWLGPPDATDVTPRTGSVRVEQAGWLVLCSDGLWNYASEADALAEVVRSRGTQDAAQLAQALVGWANEQGGRDNITVALARVEPPIHG